MKKIISGLLVVFFCALSFPGVAFAEQSVWEAACADVGGMLIGDKCYPPPTPGSDSEHSEICKSNPEYVGWDEVANKCVTQAELCDSIGMVASGNTCIEKAKYCASQGQELVDGKCKPCVGKEVYDQTAKVCFDPSVTPSTVIPSTELKETDCEKMFQYDAYKPNTLKDIVKSGKKKSLDFGAEKPTEANMVSPLDVLGCAIKTGRIHLWMVPFYIKYFIQFALSLAGLIAVGAIIIGGYFYLFGAFADDKDKGKRAIIYGIVGFIIAILAWTIVNVVISIATR